MARISFFIIVSVLFFSCNSQLTKKQREAYDIIKICDDGLAENSQDPVPYYGKAMAYFNLEKYDEAILWASKGIEVKNDFAVLYCVRGDAYYQQKKYVEAEKDYEKLYELWPAWDNASVKLSEVRQILGRDLKTDKENK